MATETATTTATDSGAATTPGSPQDGAPASDDAASLSRDAIRDAHRAALAAGAKPVDDDDEAPPPETPAPAEPDDDVESVAQHGEDEDETPAETPKSKADRPVAAIARLSSENRGLKERIKELEAAAKPADGADSIAALRARVKADPGVLMDVFGEDIEADAGKRLTRFNDSVLERAERDPKLSEQDARVSKLEQELAAERAARQKQESDAATGRARTNTARALTEGYKGEDGAVLIDAAKFPYVNHLTKVGEADCHGMVAEATGKLVESFMAEKERAPSRDEIAGLVAIAAGKIEAFYAKRAKNFQLPVAGAPKTDTERAPDRRPTTITQSMAGRAADTPKNLSVSEERERIREEHRRALRERAQA